MSHFSPLKFCLIKLFKNDLEFLLTIKEKTMFSNTANVPNLPSKTGGKSGRGRGNAPSKK